MTGGIGSARSQRRVRTVRVLLGYTPGPPMGLAAAVLAYGPFHPSLLPLLPHPAEYYSRVREGAMILERLAEVAAGSTMSRELGRVLGFESVDFECGPFDPQHADPLALEAVYEHWGYANAAIVAARFIAFRDAGFEFFFETNG